MVREVVVRSNGAVMLTYAAQHPLPYLIPEYHNYAEIEQVLLNLQAINERLVG